MIKLHFNSTGVQEDIQKQLDAIRLWYKTLALPFGKVNVPTMLLNSPSNFLAWIKIRLLIQTANDSKIQYLEVITGAVMLLCLGIWIGWIIAPFDLQWLNLATKEYPFSRSLAWASGIVPLGIFAGRSAL